MRTTIALAVMVAVVSCGSESGTGKDVSSDLEINAIQPLICDVSIGGSDVLFREAFETGQSKTFPDVVLGSDASTIKIKFSSVLLESTQEWKTVMRDGTYRIDYYGWWDPSARGNFLAAHAWSEDWPSE